MLRRFNNKLSITALSISGILATSLPLLTYAGEEEESLIAKVTAAYGGDALVNLSSYKVEDNFINLAIGQSNSPALTEIAKSSQVLVVDLKNNKRS